MLSITKAHQARFTRLIRQDTDSTMATSPSDIPPSGATAGVLFIVSSGIQKQDPATRRLIKSHVMTGRKQNRRRPGKQRKPTAIEKQSANLVVESDWNTSAQSGVQELLKLYKKSRIPAPVATDLSFMRFADDVEPAILINITKGLYSSILLTFLLKQTDCRQYQRWPSK